MYMYNVYIMSKQWSDIKKKRQIQNDKRKEVVNNFKYIFSQKKKQF
jgi:hypothetical protein